MELSVRDAAAILGKSPRALRSQLVRGELRGVKRGTHWAIDSSVLPMTDAQRAQLDARLREIHSAVDAAVPDSVRRRQSRSVADLDTFRLALGVERAVRAAGDTDGGSLAALADLDAALQALGRGKHAWDGAHKIEAFREARDRLASCVVHFLLGVGSAPDDPRLGWILKLEGEVLPSLAGLLRWAERLPGAHPARRRAWRELP